ncbi:hypothetical protein STEG23_009098, partial [Scotinomys teguina]
KNILRFLDAERDVSVVKSSFKPGDVIHYVLDRRRTLNISHNLHSLLPEVSPMKNRRFKTCAVVGNSGILLDSECGKEIDSHNFVIRCNLAPVVEFAADVGTKSDFITMNPSVVQRAFGGFRNESDREKFVHRLSMLNDSVLWIPAFMVKGGEKHVEWVNALILKNKLKVRTAYPSLRLIHAVRGYWLTNKVPIKRPSTGLLMYTLATRFCDEIHLTGNRKMNEECGEGYAEASSQIAISVLSSHHQNGFLRKKNGTYAETHRHLQKDSLNEKSPSNSSPQSSRNPTEKETERLEEPERIEDTRRTGSSESTSKVHKRSQRQKQKTRVYTSSLEYVF